MASERKVENELRNLATDIVVWKHPKAEAQERDRLIRHYKDAIREAIERGEENAPVVE